MKSSSKINKIKNKTKKDILGMLDADQVLLTESDRVIHSRDSNSRAILQIKNNKIAYPADAIVAPKNVAEVSRLLSYCQKNKIPITPYGGGSGVCGGTWTLKGGLLLDLKRLDQIIEIDPEAMTVRVEAGMNGEVLERALNTQGYSLRHFPSSIYSATIGGYLACRSAGQLSTKYGKIEDMLTSLEVVLPQGEVLELPVRKGQSKEIDMTELFMGAEGTLGVITAATFKLRKLPKKEIYRAYRFPSLKSGLEGIRKIMQSGLRPSVLRLYDQVDSLLAHSYEEDKESSWSDVLAAQLKPGMRWLKNLSLKTMLSMPEWVNKICNNLPTGCNLILCFEGEIRSAQAEAELCRKLLTEFSAKDLGEGPALYWKEHRYSVSYKLSPLFRENMFADTMEVATTWENLDNLYQKVRQAVGNEAFVLAHFSHAYHEGCSIYFTFVIYENDSERSLERYDKMWTQALDACLEAKACISHHHGVGVLKAQHMKKQWGAAHDWLSTIKKRLDPNNVLNPGKLGFKL